MRAFVGLFLVAWVQFGCGRAPISNLQVAFSEPVTQSDLKVVVPIMVVRQSPNCGPDERVITRCSATRVSDHYLTTAGHCAYDVEAIYVWHDFAKLQAIVPNREPQRCRTVPTIDPADAIRVPSSSIGAVYASPEDLAILRAEGMTQQIVEPIRFDALSPEEQDILSIGFGTIDCYRYYQLDGDTYVGMDPNSSHRYGFGKATYRAGLVVDKPYVTAFSVGEAFACNGDSGSGVLVRRKGEPDRLYGVAVRAGGLRRIGEVGRFSLDTQILTSTANCKLLKAMRAQNANFADLSLAPWCE